MSGQRKSNLKKLGTQDSNSRSTSPCPSECSEASSFAISEFDSRRSAGKPLRIAIEGNIASGKSTFLKILEDLQDEQPDYHWYVQPEPLSKWTKKEKMEKTEVADVPTGTSSSKKVVTPLPPNPSAGGEDKGTEKTPEEVDSVESAGPDKGGMNLLDAFYKDTERWAYTFEAYTFITRMHQARTAELEVQEDMKRAGAQPNAITFFERSVFSSRLVFAENSFESGSMSSTEWAIYCDWTNFVLKTVKELKLDGLVYLQCDPEICHKRMQIRQRSEEGGVPLAYLIALHDKYEHWIGPDGWMTIKDEADTSPKTPPKNITKGQSATGIKLSKLTGIHSVVERVLADVPVLVLNCSKEFKDNMENRNQMVSCVREWLASRVVIHDTTMDESIDDLPLPLADVTNDGTKSLFKSPKKRPAESLSGNLSDDEENETPRSSLPKAFKKDTTA